MFIVHHAKSSIAIFIVIIFLTFYKTGTVTLHLLGSHEKQMW